MRYVDTPHRCVSPKRIYLRGEANSRHPSPLKPGTGRTNRWGQPVPSSRAGGHLTMSETDRKAMGESDAEPTSEARRPTNPRDDDDPDADDAAHVAPGGTSSTHDAAGGAEGDDDHPSGRLVAEATDADGDDETRRDDGDACRSEEDPGGARSAERVGDDADRDQPQVRGGDDGANDGVDAEGTTAAPVKSALRLMIPNAKAGYIIGPRGATVKRLRELCGCAIHVQDHGRTASHRVVIVIASEDRAKPTEHATRDAMMRCYARATEKMLPQGTSPDVAGERPDDQPYAAAILVPQSQLSKALLHGLPSEVGFREEDRFASYAANVRTETGAEVTLAPREGEAPTCALGSDRVVTISGSDSAVSAALASLCDTLDYRTNPPAAAEDPLLLIDAPDVTPSYFAAQRQSEQDERRRRRDEQHRGGEGRHHPQPQQQWQRRGGSRDRDGSGSGFDRGGHHSHQQHPGDRTHNPHSQLSKPLPPGHVMMTFPIDGSLAGMIIGKRGANISSIKSTSGAKMTIHDSQVQGGKGGTRVVEIVGTETQCWHARGLMETTVSEQGGGLLHPPTVTPGGSGDHRARDHRSHPSFSRADGGPDRGVGGGARSYHPYGRDDGGAYPPHNPRDRGRPDARGPPHPSYEEVYAGGGRIGFDPRGQPGPSYDESYGGGERFGFDRRYEQQRAWDDRPRGGGEMGGAGGGGGENWGRHRQEDYHQQPHPEGYPQQQGWDNYHAQQQYQQQQAPHQYHHHQQQQQQQQVWQHPQGGGGGGGEQQHQYVHRQDPDQRYYSQPQYAAQGEQGPGDHWQQQGQGGWPQQPQQDQYPEGQWNQRGPPPQQYNGYDNDRGRGQYQQPQQGQYQYQQHGGQHQHDNLAQYPPRY